MVGQTISHYRLTEKLGEGGMGVVYKAEDTKLERTVALKFLASHLLNDDEAKQRFLREAKAAAALSHPNICHVYEIDESDGKTFLAMEFVKGETLEDHIGKGPLALKQALDIGRQVAEGLESAHEAGIVHRDIKPANILVDTKGRATIMDFGLARLTEASRLTKGDQTMGTVAYMSPEQVQGMEVDHRSDIWALGCVLYEMVRGQRPFQGQYDQALAYEIVHQEPEPLTGIRAGVPMELEFIVGKCLAKDREDRTNAAQEVSRELRTLAEKLKSGRSTIVQPTSMTGAAPSVVAGGTAYPAHVLPPDSVVIKRAAKRRLEALAALLGLAALGFAFAYWNVPEPERPVSKFSMPVAGLGTAAVSPDGRSIAYAATDADGTHVWVRELRNEEARRIPGTEGALNLCCAWSPDSEQLVFATGYELRRVSVDGAVSTLCRLPDLGVRFAGASWSPDGRRVAFSSGRRLYEVSSLGGEPKLILDGLGVPQPDVLAPLFLPGDDGPPALLYFSEMSAPTPRVAVLDLDSGESRELGQGVYPAYSQEGYVIYAATYGAGEGLRALPLNRRTLEPTGEAFPISTTGNVPSVSQNGTLVFRSLPPGGARGHLTVRDRAGVVLKSLTSPLDLSQTIDLAAAPDGRRVAATTSTGTWVFDLERDTATRLPQPEGDVTQPRWMNNRELNFVRTGREIMTQAADGSSAAESIYPVPIRTTYFDWSPDQHFLTFTAPDPAGGDGGIWYVERSSDGSFSEPKSFLRTRFGENGPQFSPDGRYLTYQSDESGRFEIYVRPFPDGSEKWQISTYGGLHPRWSMDGSELFYVEGTGNLMAAAVSSSSGFHAEAPQMLFATDDLRIAGLAFAVLPDGGFVVKANEAQGRPIDAHVAIGVVENWYEEFRGRGKH